MSRTVPLYICAADCTVKWGYWLRFSKFSEKFNYRPLIVISLLHFFNYFYVLACRAPEIGYKPFKGSISCYCSVSFKSPLVKCIKAIQQFWVLPATGLTFTTKVSQTFKRHFESTFAVKWQEEQSHNAEPPLVNAQVGLQLLPVNVSRKYQSFVLYIFKLSKKEGQFEGGYDVEVHLHLFWIKRSCGGKRSVVLKNCMKKVPLATWELLEFETVCAVLRISPSSSSLFLEKEISWTPLVISFEQLPAHSPNFCFGMFRTSQTGEETDGGPGLSGKICITRSPRRNISFVD